MTHPGHTCLFTPLYQKQHHSMKKLLSLFFILTVAFAYSSVAIAGNNTYYSKATAKVHETGGGKVYISKDATNSPVYGESNSATQNGSEQSHTYYLYAQPDEGYVLGEWLVNNESIGAAPQHAVTASSTDEKAPTEFTFTARFIKEPAVSVSSNDAALGSATINKLENAIGDEVTVTANVPFIPSTTSIFPADVPNWAIKFLGWFDESDNLVSKDKAYTFTVSKKTALTAKFMFKPGLTKAEGYYRVKSGWNAALRVSGNFSVNVTGQEQFYGDLDLIRNPEGRGYGYSNHKASCRYNGDPHNNIYSDAGTIMYVKGTLNQATSASYNKEADVITNVEISNQGTGTKTFLGSKEVKIRWHALSTGFYEVYNSAAAVKFQENADRWAGGDVLYPGRKDGSNQTMLLFEPIDEENVDDYWFGMFPYENMKLDGGYWTSQYTSFPYKCYEPDGAEIYIIKSVVDVNGSKKAILHKIESGIVPANTAVLIKCRDIINTDEYVNFNAKGQSTIAQGAAKMPKPANRLIPLLPNDASINPAEYEGNLLKGEFQLNKTYPDKNDPTKDLGHVIFDASKMRVLGLDNNGKVAFITASEGSELEPNRAYLDITGLNITDSEVLIGHLSSVKVAVDSTFGDLGLATIDNEENSIGSVVTISASPNTISGAFDNVDWSKFIEFDGWYDEDGNKVSSDAVFTFTVEKMQTYTAKFSWINKVRDIGYYRVKNPATNQYWTIKGNFNPTPADFTDDESRKLNRVIEFSKANDLSDPGAVLRLHSDNFDDPLTHTPNQNIVRDIVLEAQGVTTAEILPGKTVDLRAAHNAGFFKIAYDNYQIASSRHNYSDSDFGYLYISDDLSGNNDSDPDSYFEFEPLDLDHIDQFYFGAEPVSEHMFDGGYMATMYTSFPFQCYEPDGVEAFTVTEITEDNEVILEKIADGFVPAFTPVVLKCHGLTAKENRLLPVYDEYAAQADNVNLLKGEFQLNESKDNAGKKPYDPSSMRVIGINDNGEAAFVTLDGAPELEANRAYLDLSGVANPAATYSFKYANGVPTGVDDIIYDQATDNPADAIYDLMGRRVDNPVKGRIYISKGKKYVF